MPKPGGAHIKLGSYEYLLAEDMNGHYRYSRKTLMRPEDLLGSTGKNLRPEKLLWSMTDWTGGEGARLLDIHNPNQYWVSDNVDTTDEESGWCVNGRNPGVLMGRPVRSYIKTTTTNNINSQHKKRPKLTQAHGKLWMGMDQDLYATEDLTAGWTSKTMGLAGNFYCTDIHGLDTQVYMAYGDGTNRGIKKRDFDTANSDVVASHAAANPWRNLGTYKGKLYAWTGRILHEMDIDLTSSALTLNASPGYRKVYSYGSTDLTEGPYGGTAYDSWWSDMASTENSVCVMTGMRGQTTVHQYKQGAGRPIWHLPRGFTGKSMCVQNGILYVAGHWGGEGTSGIGYGQLYAMPLDTLRPVFVGYFRKKEKDDGPGLQMQEMAPTFGGQIMISAALAGRVFIYDPEYDAISQLDKMPWTATGSDTALHSQRISALSTFGAWRVATSWPSRYGTANKDVYTWYWDTDEYADRQATTATKTTVTAQEESPIYNFDIPFEQKALTGFHVAWRVEDSSTTSGMKGETSSGVKGQKIRIKYALDDESYVTAGTLDYTSTPSGGVKGRTFIQVSDGTTTKKFVNMSVKIELEAARGASTNYKPPILYDLTAEATHIALDETWTLLVRAKDEQNRTRLGQRQWPGSKARDFLRTSADDRNFLTFIDPYRYGKGVNVSSTHTVFIEEIEDDVSRHGEGVIALKLRAVTT